jgi:hypothetical protein
MKRFARRDFLKFGGGLVAGTGALHALQTILPARAAAAEVTPEAVKFRPEMEPIVRWIEDTPRDRILESAVEKLKAGLPYRALLAGVFLAGIRNIKPRPVGFKFHAVLAVNSAHQLALDAPQADRLIPLFWALDNFKGSQEADVREGDWALAPVKESAVPPPGQARQRLVEALDRWDAEAADAAVAGLCRSAGSTEVIEVLWPFGARDWENIGHKIIFTAHAWRTLETIGWSHAEPVLRSLVFGILNGGADDSSAPYTRARELAAAARADWPAGKDDEAATARLLDVLRDAPPDGAAREAADILNRGVSPASLWNAILLAAGELSLRAPGIVSLHAVTASNSLRYAYEAAATPATRLTMLFQAAAWIALYRDAVRGRGGFARELRIDRLDPEAGEPASIESVFQDLGSDRVRAARRILAHGEWAGAPTPFLDAARRLVFQKGTDSHDFKFPAAAFEDALLASPSCRPRLLAAMAGHLKGAADRDSPLVERTRRALAAL